MQKSEQRARNRAYCVCLFVRYCSMNILYIHEYTSLARKPGVPARCGRAGCGRVRPARSPVRGRGRVEL